AAENTPRMEAVQIIEDAFSYLVMAKKPDSAAAPVRWEIEKIAWQGLEQKEFYLHFPADRLILLER
ncbi:MAG: sulfate/molybdate ABC transporter ATP-binding protein, partial [Selenomonas sp.]